MLLISTGGVASVTSYSPVRGTHRCIATKKLEARATFCLATGANDHPLFFFLRTHFLSGYGWLLVCADTRAEWEQFLLLPP